MGGSTRIKLCGRLVVELEGERLEGLLPGRQGRLLFAYLVLHRGRPVRRDELLDVLWSETTAPTSADALMRAPLSRLRKALGPGRLEGRGELTLVLPPAARVDWDLAFEALRDAQAAFATQRWRAAWAGGQAALEIAEGGLLPGLEARWIDLKRAELADLRLEALEVVAGSGVRLGGAELPRAEQAARAAVEAAPFRESARAALIEVLRARGNVADALRAFEEARTLLRDELGAAPGPVLLGLHEQLLRAEPIPTAPASAAPTSPARPAAGLPDRLAAAATTPLVGRRVTLARLRSELEHARRGETAIVLLTGEGGIGKTRLIAELARDTQDFTVLYGRCDENELFPFGPWIEMLGAELGRLDDDQLLGVLGEEGPDLARLLPELRVRVPGLADPAASEPETERRRLFTAVVALVTRLARRRPLLAVIDDLHWADRSSLLLGRHLLRAGGIGPALLLGSYRDTELSERHPLVEVLADLERDRPLPRLALHGLDAAEVAELADTQGSELAPEAARAVHEETNGNPFFVKQLLRHLDEAGNHRSLEVSAGLRDVIVSRVARLPGEAGRVLRVAALMGRDFDLAVLERVVDVPDDELLDVLDAAVVAGILVEVASAPGRYSFVHALLRTALESGLSATRRARLHLRIGEAVEAQHGDRLEPRLADLARHFALAGPQAVDRAVTYAVRAAEQATGRLAYEEATDLLAGALAARERDEPVDEGERARLLHDLALARGRLGALEAARDSFAQAAEAARRVGSAELFAQAALGHSGGVWERFGTEDAASARLLEEGLVLLPEEDSALRAQLLARLGRVSYFASDSEQRGTRLLEAAVAMARGVGDDTALATALSTAQFVDWRPGRAEARLAFAQELVGVVERLGAPERLAEALVWRATPLLELCRLDEADADLERHADIARRLEQPELLAHSAALRCTRALLEGRWEEGESAAAEVRDVGERWEVATAGQFYAADMMALRNEQLRLGEHAERFARLVRELPELPGWRTFLTWAYVQGGRLELAHRQLDELSRDDFAALPRDANFAPSMATLTHVALELRDAELAADIEPFLRPLAEYWVMFGVGAAMLGPYAYCLGVCGLLTGRLEAAVDDFERAIVKARLMRARPYEAHALLGLARALAARGDPGDAERAATRRAEAVELGRGLGMPRLLRDAGVADRQVSAAS